MRELSPDHEKMGKGISWTKEEIVTQRVLLMVWDCSY
ncbi:hypothetical protein MKZ24_13680 [Paenibacillus sp. FSL R7-0297]